MTNKTALLMMLLNDLLMSLTYFRSKERQGMVWVCEQFLIQVDTIRVLMVT
jgi:hypothetical protein